MMSREELKLLDSQISANADKLIELGYKHWKKTKKKSKLNKKYATQEERVREIEDAVYSEGDV